MQCYTRYPTVLSVGASTQADLRASFSARGKRLDLLAPGVDILSTWNGVPYFLRSGTSMAALLMAQLPRAPVAQVRACLLRSATDLGPHRWDSGTGWGGLNVARVLQSCPPLIYLPIVQAH